VPCVDGSELARVFFTFAALVGAAMCSAFKCGTQGPLAIMPSADQVPVTNPHSTMRWHKWVVLIAAPQQIDHHLITSSAQFAHSNVTAAAA
jgi:hypothetical protein